ncbi:GNAT family N-acetyltransferase [Niveispirillum sp. KHB5.9]|uniref:GNAT family N-acetyltransferase n=1 Tax=Niveispirillum sp. KHB5.9 TaxID=3400269 RepID=UPI003A8C0366
MEKATRPAVTLRAMSEADLEAAHALSRELNWPHRLEDWQFFLEFGQGVVAERDGAVVGTAMCWLFGEKAGTLGMVIVSPDAQGLGIGRKLMAAVMDILGNRTMMLHATEEGLSLYQSLGFVAVGEVFQHQGTAFSVPLPELLPDERVRPMGLRDMEIITDLDARATGMDRRRLIDTMDKSALGVMLTRDHEVAGFALFRKFGRGYVVGPTVAPDIGGAKALISHWLGANAGMFCRVDVTEASGLSPWLDELGLQRVGRVTRMIRGTPVPVDAEFHTFSLVTQALG